jgi:hypothetical protein
MTTGAVQALPFLPFMRDADAQVARLVELYADDAANPRPRSRPSWRSRWGRVPSA